ncbi:MAG: radical SAM protein [Candidatus Omnitrophota bacterium]
MKVQNSGRFYNKLQNKKEHYPWSAHIELTYRCNLNCGHCYCKGSENRGEELTAKQWKTILDEIHKQGCLWLALTGGDPLIRKDFLEIYAYAKEKGFIITVFTNGQKFTKEIISYLVKSPPCSIEITLNGITQRTYEAITQVQGSFSKVMRTVKLLAKKKLPLILKTNCLKQNKNEVGKIKEFTEELLGKPAKNKYYFKYDPMIYPRFNGDKTPCQYRLSAQELIEAKKQDSDIWKQYQKGLDNDFPDLERDRQFLYRCNAWMSQFFINPYGRLKFCAFSDKFSVDLKKVSFAEGFYKAFPKLLSEKFKTDSKCRDCKLRALCYHCPARAYLETGDEEAPVPYYCELARALNEELENKQKNGDENRH